MIWIGLDGADREYLDALAARGVVPNWARVSREGYTATLRSFEPLLSPLVWTTQETGVGPDVHGVLDFQELTPSGILGPVSEASRRVPAIWNVASERGRRVGVVGFWATHPAERVNGFFLSDRLEPRGVTEAVRGSTFPETLTETVSRVLARDGNVPAGDLVPYLAGPAEDPARPLESPGTEDRTAALARVIGKSRVTQRLSRELYDRQRPDLLAVYFEGTDEIGHLFAPDAPPKLACTDPAEFDRFSRVPETYFRMVDAMLGQWMRRAKADGAVLVITSDHGFRWGADRLCGRGSAQEATAAAWHRPEGILVAWGANIPAARSEREATAFDVAPTLLALLDLPADVRMQGRPVPVREGLRDPPRSDLFAGLPVRTVAAAPVGAAEASEAARKLAALGYISARDAAASTERAPSSNGRTRGAWNNLGVYLRFTANDPAAARRAWEEALKLDPTYHSALFNVARLEKDRGRFGEASRWLLRAVAAGQPSPQATVARWAGDFARTDPAAAVELVKAASAAHPADPGYVREGALALKNANRCREAGRLIAPLESSADVATLNVAAGVEACLDRPDRVAAILRRSLELDPNQPAVREALAALPR